MGYAEQPQNLPYLPSLIDIWDLHSGQLGDFMFSNLCLEQTGTPLLL